MGLLSAVEQFKPGDRFPVVLQSIGCLHSLNKLASCEACFDICPTAAIRPGEPPSLDSRACVACRACLAACPVGAFAGEDKVKGLLSAAARAVEKHKVTHIDLLCERHASPAQGPRDSALGLRVEGCLAQLGAGAYLALFVLGIDRITVRLEACTGCAWGMLQKQCRQQAEQARALASPWGLGDRLTVLDQAEEALLEPRPGWNAAAPPLSRADLLNPAALLAESKYAELIAPDAQATGQRHLSLAHYRQYIAFQYLWAENQPAGTPNTQASGVRAVVSEDCTGCNICSQGCPTGALRRTLVEEKRFELSFSALTCVDCQVCTALCPEAALSLERPVPVGYLLDGERVLRAGSLVKCQKCGTLFSPKAGEKLCPPCQFRRENPFGARPPKELLGK